jgi:hypothetical protein
MTKQRDGLKRALSPSEPTRREWESDETAVAHRLKQEEEQHYREVLARLEAEKARLDQEVQEFLTRHPEALKTSKPSPPKKPRNRKVEDHLSKTRQAASLAKVRIDRDANGGEEEIFQVAQALILCGLPYDKTDQTKITRSARLADGSVVDVTFSTGLKAGMPYGSDRSLLHFLFDKAVKNDSRFVSWETATEFLRMMNMAQGGKNRRDLRQRFLRIRSLTIGVERTTQYGTTADLMPVIRHSHLPTSVDDGPSGGVNLYCRLVRMLFSEWNLTPLFLLISSGITFQRRPRSSGQRATSRSFKTSCCGYIGAVMQPTSPASSNGSICGCSSGKTIKPADGSRCGLRKPSPPCGSSGRSYRLRH